MCSQPIADRARSRVDLVCGAVGQVDGYSEIASDAEIQNSRSIRLHSRLGFREVSRTVHFVKTLGNQTAEQTRCSDPGETAVVDNRGSAAPL
jgi:hypothetical protein